jgi:ELWxxDGT repeat protein
VATVGNLFFFVPEEESPERNLGKELWVSDGTSEGTFVIADLNEGPEDSNPGLLTRVGNMLYFTANRTELWKTDGTTEGTERIDMLDPISPSSAIVSMAPVGKVLYLSTQRSLWRMDIESQLVELGQNRLPT